MKKEEMLKKIIEKAVKNGYKCPDVQGYYFEIIFNHNFAKAYFNDNRELRVSYEGFCMNEECNTNNELDESWGIQSWERHLQQAVISDDPIIYYYNNL